MSNVLQTINNQLEYNSTGYRPIETYFVDDSYTTGVKAFRFSAIKGDGTVGGVSEISLQYADATSGIAAKGFFFDTSSSDRYGRGDNLTAETMLFPKGVRENKGMGLVKRGEMQIADDASFNLVKYFRGLDEVVASTVGGDTITVVTGTSAVTINCNKDLTGELSIGDWIKVTNGSTTDTVQVKAVTSTTITTNTAMGNNYSTTTVITALSMIQRSIFLIEADQSGAVMPFQTLVPVTSGNLKQELGYITSQNTYVIDLSIDPNGTVL